MRSGESSAGMRRNELVRVLLVEDSPDHAELICTKLRRSKRIDADIDHAERFVSVCRHRRHRHDALLSPLGAGARP